MQSAGSCRRVAGQRGLAGDIVVTAIETDWLLVLLQGHIADGFAKFGSDPLMSQSFSRVHMFRPTDKTNHLVVLVAANGPEQVWPETLPEPAVIVQTNSAMAALRLAPSFGDAIWLLDTSLRHVDCFDLLDMLLAINPALEVCVFDDRYDLGHEELAFRGGATRYRVAPLTADALEPLSHSTE